MIRHDDVRVEGTETLAVCRAQLLGYLVCDLWTAQIDRSTTGRIQQSVKSDERLPRGCMLAGEDALLWEAPPESPGDKRWRTRSIPVRETATILSHLGRVPAVQV
jgi:hypothetical protein